VHRQHQNPHLLHVLGDAAGQQDAIDTGQGDVDDRKVGLDLAKLLQASGPVMASPAISKSASSAIKLRILVRTRG
jgi:hypothetical protein